MPGTAFDYAARPRRSPRQRLAHAVGRCVERERRARHVCEDLVGGGLLALRPQLADERARIPAGEPRIAELLAQVRAHLRLERPRPQVVGRVEAVVDVGEIVGVARVHLQRVAEQLDVARPHRGDVADRVELDLVEELRAVPAQEPQELRRAFRRELVRAREVESPVQPRRVDRQMLEQHRPALGDGDVARAGAPRP